MWYRMRIAKLRKSKFDSARPGFKGRELLPSGITIRWGEEEPISTVRKLSNVAAQSYLKRLVELSGEVYNSRSSARINSLIDDALAGIKEPAIGFKEPRTLGDVLLAALDKMGYSAEITFERKSKSCTIFSVRMDGQLFTIPLRESSMDAADPLKAVEKSLIANCIEPKKTDKAGISQDTLDRLIMHFDEKLGDFKAFTYKVTGSTFLAPADMEGDALVGFIGRKIVGMHMDFSSSPPIAASVLEEIESQSYSPECLESIKPEELSTIAKVLHRLVEDEGVTERMVPEEYRQAFVELRGSDEFYDLKEEIRFRDWPKVGHEPEPMMRSA